MQSLELLLDEESDEAVRREWLTLSRAGLRSQADHTGPTNAPHITVLATEDHPAPDDEMGSELAGLLPLPLRLGPVIAFPGRRLVLARLVIVDRTLLELHASVVRAARVAPTPLTTPGRWVPHVTLARGIPMDDVGPALSLLRAPGLDASVTRLRRWDSEAEQTHDVVPADAPG